MVWGYMNEWVWSIGGMILTSDNWSTWRRTSLVARLSIISPLWTSMGITWATVVSEWVLAFARRFATGSRKCRQEGGRIHFDACHGICMRNCWNLGTAMSTLFWIITFEKVKCKWDEYVKGRSRVILQSV